MGLFLIFLALYGVATHFRWTQTHEVLTKKVLKNWKESTSKLPHPSNSVLPGDTPRSPICQRILSHFPELAQGEGVREIDESVRLPEPLQIRIQEEIQKCISVNPASPFKLELEVFSSEQENWSENSDIQFQMSLIHGSTGNKEEESAFSLLVGQLDGEKPGDKENEK